MCVDKVHEYTYDIDGPRGELSSFDGVEQSLDAVIGVLTSKLASFLVCESLWIGNASVPLAPYLPTSSVSASEIIVIAMHYSTTIQLRCVPLLGVSIVKGMTFAPVRQTSGHLVLDFVVATSSWKTLAAVYLAYVRE
jgi:hypothetical protein